MGRDWQEELLGFAFADPWFLACLPLVVVLVLVRRRTRGAAVGFASLRLVASLPSTLRARLTGLPLYLAAVGLLACALALARPQSLTRLPVESEGIDILLCLDLSSSMSALDMEPTRRRDRLDVAKQVARDFVEGREFDRVGLVGFALFPDLLCPPTLDHDALLRFLAPLAHKRPGDPEDRTGIGLGLALCVKLLGESEAASKVVILLTDGEENVQRILPVDAGKLAKDAGVRVYTIGVGKGTVHPMLGIVQKPDFGPLAKVAEITGGLFFEAGDERGLATVFERIDGLEKVELADPLYVADELFSSFLFAGVSLVSAAFLLRLTWFAQLP